MKVIVNSSIHHNVSSIGKEALERIQRDAERIVRIDFASFLSNIDLLTVALYASDPAVAAQHLRHPLCDFRRRAAHRAKMLHADPSKLTAQIRSGFFHRQLRALLEIGNHNSDFGAKLVPVFNYMLEHKEDHSLDAELVEGIKRFLSKRDFVDGFSIISQTADSCYVVPSSWKKGVA